jgi:hypothetical protein
MSDRPSSDCRRITGRVIDVVNSPISRIRVAAQIMRLAKSITSTRDENVIKTLAFLALFICTSLMYCMGNTIVMSSLAISNAAYTIYRLPTLVQVGYTQPASICTSAATPSAAIAIKYGVTVLVKRRPMSMSMEILASHIAAMVSTVAAAVYYRILA